MSIYNLENSHLIVFDRRSPQINKSSRQPQTCACICTNTRMVHAAFSLMTVFIEIV